MFDRSEKYVIQLKATRNKSTFQQLFNNNNLAFKKYKELSDNGFAVEWIQHDNLTIDEFISKQYNFGAM